ncbi:MAG: ROK family protein [Pirellulaceae bacterium]
MGPVWGIRVWRCSRSYRCRGGLISEGRLINGVNSFGSEMGHMVVDSRPDARLCVWGGGRGQLEAYASAAAVAAQAMLGVHSGSKAACVGSE